MSVARIDSAALCRDYPIEPFIPEPRPRVRVRDGEYKYRCAFHADRTPSMLVGPGGYYCYGCGAKGDVIRFVMETRKLGFLDAVRAITNGAVPPAAELHPQPRKDHDALPHTMFGKSRGRIVATYDYADEQGVLLYQVVRLEPKSFRQRQPHPSGHGWLWTMQGARRVLYRLPELLEADPAQTVFVVEGEKDVDAMRGIGRVATCNVGGAGKWRPEYGEALRGRRVLVVPDNDAPGERHAEQVRAALTGVAASVELWRLPATVKDISDLLAKRRRDQQRGE